MSKQVFFDPQRKRWKRLRRVTDSLALTGVLLGVLFIVGLVRMKPMQGLDLRSTAKKYRALSKPPANVKFARFLLNDGEKAVLCAEPHIRRLRIVRMDRQV